MDHDEEKCVSQIAAMVSVFRKDPECELEGSVGTLNLRSYSPSVSFDHFKKFWTCVSTSPAFTNTEERNMFASYFFSDDVRGRFDGKSEPSFVQKFPMRKALNLKCHNRRYDLRVNLKKEKPVDTRDAPVLESPRFVRLQQRWSYVYKKVWKYDLTKVSSGKDNKETACKAAPVFEIELELLRDEHFLSSHSDEAIARSFLAKLVDLLGRHDGGRESPHLQIVDFDKIITPASHQMSSQPKKT